MFKWLFILLFSCTTLSAQIPKDKQLHLVAGSVVGAWGYITVPDKGYNREIAAVSWGTAAGLGKEFMDGVFKTGTVDKKDVYYTVAGAVGTAVLIRATREIVKAVKKNKRYERNNNYKR